MSPKSRRYLSLRGGVKQSIQGRHRDVVVIRIARFEQDPQIANHLFVQDDGDVLVGEPLVLLVQLVHGVHHAGEGHLIQRIDHVLQLGYPPALRVRPSAPVRRLRDESIVLSLTVRLRGLNVARRLHVVHPVVVRPFLVVELHPIVPEEVRQDLEVDQLELVAHYVLVPTEVFVDPEYELFEPHPHADAVRHRRRDDARLLAEELLVVLPGDLQVGVFLGESEVLFGSLEFGLWGVEFSIVERLADHDRRGLGGRRLGGRQPVLVLLFGRLLRQLDGELSAEPAVAVDRVALLRPLQPLPLELVAQGPLRCDRLSLAGQRGGHGDVVPAGDRPFAVDPGRP